MKFEDVFDKEDFEYDTTSDIDTQLRDTRRELLEDSLARVTSLDDCWAVFRQTVTEAVLDDALFNRVVTETREIIARSIFQSEKERITNIAALKLIAKERAAVIVEAANTILNDPDAVSEIKHVAVALLMDQLRKEVEQDVKQELKTDPKFVEAVKRELKLQIMGI